MSSYSYKNRRKIRAYVVLGMGYLVFIISMLIVSAGTMSVYRYMRADMLKPAAVACYIQRINQALMFQQNKVHIPILMYHYVEYVQDKKDKKRQLMNIQPNVFEQHLKDLTSAGYQTLLVRDIPRILTGKADVCMKAVVLSFDDGYVDFYTDVYPLLKKYHVKATVFIIADYIGRDGFLTKEQIQEMLEDGTVEIGSHTLDHFYLKKAVLTEQKHQIADSKKLLEDTFKVRVKSFSYPFGALDNHSIDYVKEASYSAAVTVEPGSYVSLKDVFTLPRIRPEKLEGNIANALSVYSK